MAEWAKVPGRFTCSGIDIKHALDNLPPGKYPGLLNVVSNVDDVLESREGLTLISATGASGIVHSLKRVNNKLPAATHSFLRFAGVGTGLYVSGADGTWTGLPDTPYSGNPLSLIPFRPNESPAPWVYIADSNQLRKASMDGSTVWQWGVTPPTYAPLLALGTPNSEVVSDFGSSETWTTTGNAGSVTKNNARVSAGVTISKIVYDSGSNGWASVQASGTANNWLGVGARLQLGSEWAIVDQTFIASPTTTIAAILYDSGSTGACTISAATNYSTVARNQVVQVGSEYARVLSVTVGPDGQYSFRCNTTGTHSAGQTITFIASFRVFLTGTHTAGEAITGLTTTVQFTGAGSGAMLAAKVINLASVGGRELQEQDYLHLSVRVDHPENVQEIRLWFDVDTNGNNDFLHNSFYYAFRPSDQQAVLAGNLTALTGAQTALQNQQIDAAGNVVLSSSVSGQMALGSQAWTELFINLAGLQRNGTDPGSTLATVAKMQISAITLDTCVVEVSSWWAGGTYGPDINQQIDGPAEQEILYRYKYRSSTTGARSMQSPSTRSGVLPKRAAVLVQCVASTDLQVDAIDIERIGGSLSDWHYVGTTSNSSPTYLDTLMDDAVEVNAALDTASRPFPVEDRPRRGVCSTAGTTISWVSGDVFNVNWEPGAQIKINGTPYTLWGPPRSTTQMEVFQNIGALSNVTFEIVAPTIMGFPLPIAFGGSTDGTIFGLGDPYNPGRLYFCRNFDPDTCPDTSYIEVSSPSEPLISGCCDETGNKYVFTSARPYLITAAPAGSPNPWVALPVPARSGLYAPWALAVGVSVFFLGLDGIYEMTSNGASGLITFEDIDPLFPKSGVVDNSLIKINGGPGPNFASLSTLRLSIGTRYLWFDYADALGNWNTLAFDLVKRGWFPWAYVNPVSLHYQEEGPNLNSVLAGSHDGRVYQLGLNGYGDDGAYFSCSVQMPCFNAGDARNLKQWGDVFLDYSSSGGTELELPTVQISFNNYQVNPSVLSYVLPTTGTFPTTGTRDNTFFDLHAITNTGFNYGGFDRDVYNSIGMTFTFTNSLGGLGSTGVRLYGYEYSYIAQGEYTYGRFTDWSDGGYSGNKFLQGMRLRLGWLALLPGQTLSTILAGISVESDTGDSQLAYVSGTPQYGVVSASLDPPLLGHLFRVLPVAVLKTRDALWRIEGVEYIFEAMPDGVPFWISQWTDHGGSGYQHLREMQVAYYADSPITFTIYTDNGQAVYTLPSTRPYPLWSPNTSYAAGSRIIDSNGNIQVAQDNGVSGFAPPLWETIPGYDTEDGVSPQFAWQMLSAAPITPRKYYLELAPAKSKMFQYSFETQGAFPAFTGRFRRDCFSFEITAKCVSSLGARPAHTRRPNPSVSKAC